MIIFNDVDVAEISGQQHTRNHTELEQKKYQSNALRVAGRGTTNVVRECLDCIGFSIFRISVEVVAAWNVS